MTKVGTLQDSTCKIQSGILFTLQYFAMWNYPLTTSEIHKFSNVSGSIQEITNAVLQLTDSGLIYSHEDFYSTKEEIKALVLQRKKGNALAEKKLAAAMRAGKIIYAFPFVKYVGISGSLSKGYAEDKSDFDFFIVTQENRLWISRTLLHLFKKLTFLFGQQHKFCMNYFIDESALEIKERNYFVAIELATLIAVKGFAINELLHKKNTWLKHFLPNAYMRNTLPLELNKPILKTIAENLFNMAYAANLNVALMQFTDKLWQRKWRRKNYPMQDYCQAFKTRINVSKNHPANYQKIVLRHLKKIEYTAQQLLQP